MKKPVRSKFLKAVSERAASRIALLQANALLYLCSVITEDARKANEKRIDRKFPFKKSKGK